MSYAHDTEGEILASFIVRELRARGCLVFWDKDSINPASLQEWMERQIEENIVICDNTSFEFEVGAQWLIRPSHSGEAGAGDLSHQNQVSGRLYDPLRRGESLGKQHGC